MLLFLLVPLFIVFLGLCIGAGLLYGAVRARKRIAVIEGARLCRADQLRPGMAKMRGRIIAIHEEDLLVSPLSRTTCVYYRFVIEEQRTRTVHHGKHAHTETYWHPVVTDVQAAPCTVRDDTGEARIDLAEAEIVLTQGQQTHSGMFNDAPTGLQRRLRDLYGFSTQGLIFNKSLRYTEKVIEEGVKVFVVGEVEVRKSGKTAFVKGDDPLLVTDKNERDLVSHYRWRATAFTIAAIVVPLLFLACGGFFGIIFYSATSTIAQAGRAVQQGQSSQPGQPLQPQDEITRCLKDFQHPTDKWVRVRAADAIWRLPVQPARRDEVAAALNALLNDGDKDVRMSALRAVKKWGTRRLNEEAVKRLTASADFFEKQEANDTLGKLAP